MLSRLLDVLDLPLLRLPECQLFLVNKLVLSLWNLATTLQSTGPPLSSICWQCPLPRKLSCVSRQQDRPSALLQQDHTHIARKLKCIRFEHTGDVACANTVHE